MTIVRRKASLNLDFLIVGGGIAGLATAFALAQSGHIVRIYEKCDGIHQRAVGVRIPPNLCKILYEWGLQGQLSKASRCRKSTFHSMETNEIMGYIEWQEDVIRETGGDFLLIPYDELHHMLYQLATSEGVTVRFNAEITSVFFDHERKLPAALLADGTILTADLIIGADGYHSIVRENVTGKPDTGVSSGHTFFSVIVPSDKMKEDPDWSKWLDTSEWPMWMGDNRVLLVYPINGGTDYSVHASWPETHILGADVVESWNTFCPTNLLDFEGCHPSIERIFAMVPDAMRTKYVIRQILENWVDDSGTILLLGEAAHALMPFTMHNCSLAVEDAAVLGVLMSHLQTRGQVPQFLEAFQELRLARTQHVHQSELNNAYQVSLPPGELREMRDASFRLSLLHIPPDKWNDHQLRAQWEEVGESFGYNALEAAEDWWVKWGALSDITKNYIIHQPFEMMFQVTEVAITEP